VFTIRQRLTGLAERIALEFEAMGAGQEAVEQSVGDGWLVQVRVPGTDRQLAGDDRRAGAVPILDDFQQVVAFVLGQGFEAEVVQDQQVESGQLPQGFAVAAVAAGDAQFVEQPARPFIAHAQSLSARGLAEGASQPTFPGAGRPRQMQVLMRANPVAVDERDDLRTIQTAFGLIVNLLDAGLLFQVRRIEQPLQATILTMRALAIHQQRKAFFK
jgi:hypothetical protein